MGKIRCAFIGASSPYQRGMLGSFREACRAVLAGIPVEIVLGANGGCLFTRRGYNSISLWWHGIGYNGIMTILKGQNVSLRAVEGEIAYTLPFEAGQWWAEGLRRKGNLNWGAQATLLSRLGNLLCLRTANTGATQTRQMCVSILLVLLNKTTLT